MLCPTRLRGCHCKHQPQLPSSRSFYCRRPLRARSGVAAAAPPSLPLRQGLQACRIHHKLPKYGADLRCRAAKAAEAEPADADIENATFEQYPLQLQWQELPKSRLRCFVEVPQPLVARFWYEILKELRKQYPSIPGYRPQDPVPEHLIIHEHGGLDKFKYSVIEAILETTASEALKDHADKMIRDSDSFDDSSHDLFAQLDKNKSFKYSVSADVYPTLRWLRPYDQMKVQVEAVEHPDAEEAVEQHIKLMRLDSARTTMVQGRGMQAGDVCIVQFEAQSPENGAPMPGTKHERMQLDTNNPGQIPLRGVVEAMEGMQLGEQRSFVLPVPSAWEAIAEGAPEVKVVVKLLELFTYIDVPELTDEWVERHSPEQGTVANLRNNVLQAFQEKAKVDTQEKVHMALMEELANIVEVDVPECMIVHVAQNEFQAQLFEIGQKLGIEQMKALSTEENYNAYIENRRPELEMMQRSMMAVEEIFVQEELEVNETDMVNEVNAAMDEAKQHGQELDVERLKEQAFEVLKANAVQVWLENKSDITIVPAAAAAS